MNDIDAFYQSVATVSFTLLGLWWVVLQLKFKEGRGDARRRRHAYGVALFFLLPGVMSMVSSVNSDALRAVARRVRRDRGDRRRRGRALPDARAGARPGAVRRARSSGSSSTSFIAVVRAAARADARPRHRARAARGRGDPRRAARRRRREPRRGSASPSRARPPASDARSRSPAGPGTLGRAVPRLLAERGHEVVVLSRTPPRSPVAGVEHRPVDLGGRRRRPRRGALEGCEVVVDAVNGTPTRQGTAFLVAASRRLLGAAREAGVRHHVLASIVGHRPRADALLPREGRAGGGRRGAAACRGRSCAPRSSTRSSPGRSRPRRASASSPPRGSAPADRPPRGGPRRRPTRPRASRARPARRRRRPGGRRDRRPRAPVEGGDGHARRRRAAAAQAAVGRGLRAGALTSPAAAVEGSADVRRLARAPRLAWPPCPVASSPSAAVPPTASPRTRRTRSGCSRASASRATRTRARRSSTARASAGDPTCRTCARSTSSHAELHDELRAAGFDVAPGRDGRERHDARRRPARAADRHAAAPRRRRGRRGHRPAQPVRAARPLPGRA